MKTWKAKIHLIAEEFFQFSLITYLILLLTETFKEGFVSYFFNLNILLTILVVTGVILVLFHKEKVRFPSSPKKIKVFDIFLIILLTLVSAFLVFIQTVLMGDIALVLTGIAALIIFCLSFLFLTEKPTL